MTLKINGQPVEATHFAFDGCHKIYLINSPEDMATMEGFGYARSGIELGSSGIYPIQMLPTVWANSCQLRFINRANLETVVPQFADDEGEVVVEWVGS